MIRKFALFLGLMASGSPLLTGCGSKSSTKIEVKGQVWYHGAPLNGGVVVFAPDPDRGNNGPMAKGTIQSDGTFTLTTDNTMGVLPGWYRIAIAAQPNAESSLPTVPNPYPGPAARYRNPELSGLLGEVKPGTDNHFNFELDDS